MIKCAVFHSVLTKSCTNSTVSRTTKTKNQEPKTKNHESKTAATKANTKDSFPAVAMAAAVCLKSRCREIIAVQMLITTFLSHSNWLTTLARLKDLSLGTSHTYFYNKLDEFGKDHTQAIKEAVNAQGKYMEKRQESANENSVPTDTESQHLPSTPDAGRKLTFDNLDFRQQVHYKTEENQNIDKHCVTVMSTENRVSGNHLSDEKPSDGILEMENGKCIPDHQESLSLRENYIALVGRIIIKNLPKLEFLSEVATHYNLNQYKGEMSTTTNTTFLGMIHESENDADGILTTIRELHQYFPFYGEDKERVYGDQVVVGDQLSVERGVNGHNSLATIPSPLNNVRKVFFSRLRIGMQATSFWRLVCCKSFPKSKKF